MRKTTIATLPLSLQSKAELETAVEACLKLSPEGDCSNGPHGLIGEWDVSRVADMNAMFYYASAFNNDISKWDVSSVENMDHMFLNATSFKQQLCGAAWVNSKAIKVQIFKGSSGSISRPVCKPVATTLSTNQVFLPQSKSELKDAIDACLKESTTGDCSDDPYGPVGEWDVSNVVDMSYLFTLTNFNGDISKWDVSRVIDMSHTFASTSFNGDISKWDVSKVAYMSHMAHVGYF